MPAHTDTRRAKSQSDVFVSIQVPHPGGSKLKWMTAMQTLWGWGDISATLLTVASHRTWIRTPHTSAGRLHWHPSTRYQLTYLSRPLVASRGCTGLVRSDVGSLQCSQYLCVLTVPVKHTQNNILSSYIRSLLHIIKSTTALYFYDAFMTALNFSINVRFSTRADFNDGTQSEQ